MVTAAGVRVDVAQPGDWGAGLAWLWADQPAEVRQAQVRQALEFAARGELAFQELLVARPAADAGPIGALLMVPQPGGVWFLWPPNPALPLHVARALLLAAAERIDADPACRFAQCLLEHDQRALSGLLEICGFPVLAHLLILLRTWDEPLPPLPPGGPVSIPFADGDDDRFADLIERTFRDSLDCPPLDRVRTGRESLEGHRNAGPFAPELWRRYEFDGRDVGLAIWTPHASGVHELLYLGVVPEARGQGWGTWLTLDGLHRAAATGASGACVAVDAANIFARNIYDRLGFAVADRKRAHLRLARGGAGK